MSKGCVDGGAVNFDGNDRVQYPDGAFERLEGRLSYENTRNLPLSARKQTPE